MTENIMRAVEEYVRAHRGRMRALAEEVGTSYGTIAAISRGHANPSVHIVQRLLDHQRRHGLPAIEKQRE